MLQVVRYHSLIIDAESLPKELVPIAWTSFSSSCSFLEMQNSDFITHAHDSRVRSDISFDASLRGLYNGICPFSHSKNMPRKKILMGIMHTTRPHYGLQFHPESIATCHGRQIFENFRDLTKDYWQKLRSTYIYEKNFAGVWC
uniref:Aminodeoxychorismate synthaseic n=1 Tax=Rhizophora mucronata TaxID=61149 RepID=A0A2P2JXW6_RHIMU